MQALGSIGAFLLPFFLINTKEPVDPEKVKDQLYTYFMVHIAIAAFLLFLSLGLFKENEHNNEDESKDSEETISTGEKLKFLFKDSVYIAMFLSASLVFGLLPALGNSVSPIITVWGLEEVG
jgi:Na+/H+ antiporter NhaC